MSDYTDFTVYVGLYRFYCMLDYTGFIVLWAISEASLTKKSKGISSLPSIISMEREDEQSNGTLFIQITDTG